MNRKLLQAAFLLGLVIATSAQGASRPDVPAKINAPAGEQVVLIGHATGSQIYSCQQATDGKFGWTLKAPQATLRDDQGRTIGLHYAGPAWKLNDGSEVTGKAVARVDSPATDSIPWLLVTVASHFGNGMLSRVTTIQRINTRGGQPPMASQCDASKKNVEAKSGYTADYYFYAPSN